MSVELIGGTESILQLNYVFYDKASVSLFFTFRIHGSITTTITTL